MPAPVIPVVSENLFNNTSSTSFRFKNNEIIKELYSTDRNCYLNKNIIIIIVLQRKIHLSNTGINYFV